MMSKSPIIQRASSSNYLQETDDNSILTNNFLLERNESDSELCHYIMKFFVKKSEIFYFESVWLQGIYEILLNKRGFKNRVVIPPSKDILDSSDDNMLEYIVVVYFDGIANIREWQTSEDRKYWLDRAVANGITITDSIEEYGGLSEKETGEITRLVIHNTVKTPSHAPPPPKWKLYILIDIGALATVLATLFAGQSQKMRLLHFPKGSITLITLIHVVIMIAYCTNPILVNMPFISRWLRKPRHLPTENSSTFLQLIGPILRILDSGFEIFSAPTKEGPPAEILNRLSKVEGHVNKLRRVNFDLHKKIDSLEDTIQKLQQSHPATSSTGNTTGYQPYRWSSTPNLSKNNRTTADHQVNMTKIDPVLKVALGYTSQLNDTHTVPVSHHINSSSGNDAWNKMTTGRPGEEKGRAATATVTGNQEAATRRDDSTNNSLPLSPPLPLPLRKQDMVYPIDPSPSSPSDLPKDTAAGATDTVLTMVVAHQVKWECALAFEDWTRQITTLMSTYPGFLGLISISPEKDGDPYVNCFTYQNYDCLQNFLQSTERRMLMIKLESLLEGTTTAQLSQERILHDVFSELFVATGSTVGIRPPAMWKTCMLTVLSLQMIAWPFNLHLIPMLLSDGVNVFLASTIVTSLNVFVSVYVGVPFLHLLFGAWLRLPRPVYSSQPWKALDSGLTTWQRVIMASIYFGFLLGFGIHERL